jgi:hypothetical protein
MYTTSLVTQKMLAHIEKWSGEKSQKLDRISEVLGSGETL